MTVAVCCCVLQCVAVCRSVAVCCSILQCVCSDSVRVSGWGLVYTRESVFVRYCNTLQHTAKHCNTLQHTWKLVQDTCISMNTWHIYMYARVCIYDMSARVYMSA